MRCWAAAGIEKRNRILKCGGLRLKERFPRLQGSASGLVGDSWDGVVGSGRPELFVYAPFPIMGTNWISLALLFPYTVVMCCYNTISLSKMQMIIRCA